MTRRRGSSDDDESEPNSILPEKRRVIDSSAAVFTPAKEPEDWTATPSAQLIDAQRLKAELVKMIDDILIWMDHRSNCAITRDLRINFDLRKYPPCSCGYVEFRKRLLELKG